MSVKPVLRPALFNTYWKLAAERQRIFFKRFRREPAPWTSDAVLGQYKFCNTYRASDRVTQYLIRHVIYRDEVRHLQPEDIFLRVVLFRLFSKETTWNAIEEGVGLLTRKTFSAVRLGDLLQVLKGRSQPIYTAAFILPSYSSYGYQQKHRNHLALVEDMFIRSRFGRTLAQAQSLRDIYAALVEWPGLGPFLAYQLAVDLNYTELLDFSESEFTVPGPGALRGLQKAIIDPGPLSPQDLIRWTCETQEEHFSSLGIEFRNLFGRPLQAIDCQGLFCELDKYARVAFPELRSNRTRIKRSFVPHPEPLDTYYYPPKWGINKAVEEAASKVDSIPKSRAVPEQNQLVLDSDAADSARS